MPDAPSSALLQKLLGYKMAEFKVTIRSMWEAETGDFEQLVEDPKDIPQAMEEEEEEEQEDDN